MGAASLNGKAKDLLDALREATKPKPDIIPAGWYSRADLKRQLHIGDAALTEALKEVGAEQKYFRAVGPKGKLVAVSLYHMP